MPNLFGPGFHSSHDPLLKKNNQQETIEKERKQLVLETAKLLTAAIADAEEINAFRQQNVPKTTVPDVNPQTQQPTFGFLYACSKGVTRATKTLNTYQEKFFGAPSVRNTQVIYQARVTALQLCLTALEGTDSSVNAQSIETHRLAQRDQSVQVNGKKQHQLGIYDSPTSPIAVSNQPVVELMLAVERFLTKQAASKQASTPCTQISPSGS